jgi:hypothetical protein
MVRSIGALFALVVLGSSGCVFVETATFKGAATGGTCSARIFHTPPPAGEYEEIGFVKGTAGALASVDAARAELQAKACEAGADAVYIAVPTYPRCSAIFFQPMNVDGVLLKRTSSAPPAAMPAPMAD